MNFHFIFIRVKYLYLKAHQNSLSTEHVLNKINQDLLSIQLIQGVIVESVRATKQQSIILILMEFTLQSG